MQQTAEVFWQKTETGQKEQQFYQDWLPVLEQALYTVVARVEYLCGQIAVQQGRSPLEHCKWRIKKADSIQDKLRRRGLEPTLAMA
ncbi:MAG: hypothetical protein ACI3U1_05485 [Peptococcaceae bacterium]